MLRTPEPYTPESTLLSVRDIYKSFGSNAVLKGVSIDLEPG